MGIALTRANMSNWVIQCAASWLKSLCERMRVKLLTYDIVMSDERPSSAIRRKVGRHLVKRNTLFMLVAPEEILPESYSTGQ
jgi:hypothetical protein